MSKFKGSPGPYKVNMPGRVFVMSARNFNAICEVNGHERELGVVAANAHLLAASWDMLDALERIVIEAEALGGKCPPAPHACSACEILHVARAAIAKATGATS